MSSHPTDTSLGRWGPNVAARRTELGLFGAELARRLDISANHLSRIERGKAKPAYEMQVRIAEQLQTTVTRLFPRTGDEAALPDIADEYDQLLARTGNGCS